MYCIVLYCIVLYCAELHPAGSVRHRKKTKKITHMQNLFTKLINCLNFSKFVSVTVSRGKLFHNFIRSWWKKEVQMAVYVLLIVVLFSVCDGIELQCVVTWKYLTNLISHESHQKSSARPQNWLFGRIFGVKHRLLNNIIICLKLYGDF